MIIIKTFNPEKKYYVYVWFYKDSGKVFYVGKGTKYRYRSKKRDNTKLVEIINSYDCDSKIIKNNLDEEEAFEFEKEAIKFYRKNNHPLINIQDGGHLPPSCKGRKLSYETRKKMSISMNRYYENHPEVIEAQSKKMIEFFKTEQGKEFQRKSIESRNNDEFRRLQSIRCKKANQTQEYITRQSAIAKETWKSQKYAEAHMGSNNCRAQAVRQYDLNHNFIEEYSTIAEADKLTGINFRYISRAAKGERKTAGGYIWEYANERKIIQSKSSFVYDVKKDKSAVPIIQFDMNGNMIAEYNSVGEATRTNNFANRTNITQNLRGKTKSAYGYVWMYKHDNTMPSRKKDTQ